MHWMREPKSSLKLLLIPWILYFNWNIFAPGMDNPFKYLLFINYRMPDSPDHAPLYIKGYGDIAFTLYYIIVFSFIRQSLTLWFLGPLGRRLGIRSEAKIERFTEQGYAIIYFFCTGVIGLLTMAESPAWFFKTQHFFEGYPYWRLTGLMKSYYLVQFSYWLQQFLVLALGLEKPRKDFYQLCAHHFVTIWLIGWSYLVNCTPMGNAVFITMDISDFFFALAKAFNYLKMETVASIVFATFVGVWTYLRHYLNLLILWSIISQWDLLPEWTKVWSPEQGVWLADWMRWQMFGPILVLQAVNIYWYFLIWRVLLRALFGTRALEDDRSDDEGDDGVPDAEEKDD
jgi:acyl-CoA-dependent ceramide synthase